MPLKTKSKSRDTQTRIRIQKKKERKKPPKMKKKRECRRNRKGQDSGQRVGVVGGRGWVGGGNHGNGRLTCVRRMGRGGPRVAGISFPQPVNVGRDAAALQCGCACGCACVQCQKKKEPNRWLCVVGVWLGSLSIRFRFHCLFVCLFF